MGGEQGERGEGVVGGEGGVEVEEEADCWGGGRG